jgi:hypothetical protein
VLLHSDHWLRKEQVGAGHGMSVNLPQISYKGMALLTDVRPAECVATAEGELKAVFHRSDDNDNGLLVLGARRTRSKGSFSERRANLRLISLELIERRGHLARRVNIELLRSMDWIREQNVRVGGAVFLDEPKERLRGRAKVKGIQPCPPRERWLEKMPAGEFKPWSCRVGDLKIASESKPIGVTPPHPFWCPEKKAWVSAGRLEPGDLVQTLHGPSAVEWFVMREKPVEEVYNIEVEGDHVYRVGESGVLVHNASAPCNPCVHNASCPAYRTGGRTATNLTPRPGRDDAANGGLSLTEMPGRGWLFTGGKSQIQGLGFETQDDRMPDDPTHFLVRPGTALIAQGWTLQAWAAARPGIDPSDRSTWPEPTKILLDAAQEFTG